MWEIGFCNQQGELRFSHREHSRYHDLLEYILTDGEHGSAVSYIQGRNGPISYDWRGAHDCEEMSKKDSSLAALFSESEKSELCRYLKFAYESQVRRILQADNPRDFVYRAAETVGVIKQSRAWPLPNSSGNHQ